MSLDLSEDWRIIDDTETVNYFVKVGEGKYTPKPKEPVVPIPYCARDVLPQDASLLQNDTLVWHLWTANLGGIVPKTGDYLADQQGDAWMVKIVEELDHDANGVQRYRLVCTKMIV